MIIPSLGAFIISRRPAYFNREAGVIYPPVDELMFNASIVNNDGQLANSLARKLRITYQEAAVLVGDYAAELKETLETTGSLTFPRLGRLDLGEEGNIVFTPALSPAEHARRLGLMPVRIAPAAKEESKPAAVAEEKAPARDPRYFYFRIRKSALRAAAAIAAIIFLAVIGLRLSVDYNNYVPAEQQASVIPVRIAPAKEKKVAPTVPDSLAAYQLVVGAFFKEADADLFIRQHAADGFSMGKLRRGKYIQVTAYRDNDSSSVAIVLNSGKVRKSFGSAWILRR